MAPLPFHDSHSMTPMDRDRHGVLNSENVLLLAMIQS